jgi:hypothetical protein
MTDRSEYVKGLRALADFLEANEAVKLPQSGSSLPIYVYPKSRSELSAWASVLTAKQAKVEELSPYPLKLRGMLDGVRVLASSKAALVDSVVTETVTVEKREYDLTGLTDEATS